MTKLAEVVLAARPDWTHPIPEELEQAWSWLEEQGGYAEQTSNGYFLATAPGPRQLGPVFGGLLTLVGWFEPGSDGFARILPIAEIDGSGSIGALWRDGDAIRVVALGSEGAAFILANTAREFLALLAMGYREFDRYELAVPPDDDEAIDAVAEFRAWVVAQGIEVPESWQVEDDAFTEWVAQQLGWTAEL